VSTIETFSGVRVTCACCGVKERIEQGHHGKTAFDRSLGCIALRKKGWYSYVRQCFTYDSCSGGHWEPSFEEYNGTKVKRTTWVCPTCKPKADIIMNQNYAVKIVDEDKHGICAIQDEEGETACSRCMCFDPFKMVCEDLTHTPYIVSVK